MPGSRTVRVFRYDPAEGAVGRYDSFQVPVGEQTTVLDALAWIQATQDPTLAFRYACRVGMCGSCAMVVNGRERWTCRTRLGDLGGEGVTVRPLYHFPLVKDLVVDMAPFRERMERVGAVYAGEARGFVPISPDSAERQAIDSAIECIGCGACLSACSMVDWRPEFPGPAALLRAFTLAEDSREGGREGRLVGLLSEDALWQCHIQANCTAVCPMELSPAEAISRLKRRVVATALVRARAPRAQVREAVEPKARVDVPRRRLLHGAALGLAAAVTVPLASLLARAALDSRPAERGWLRVGPLPALAIGRPVEVQYDVMVRDKGRDRLLRKRAYLVKSADDLVAFDPQCTHLGCASRWDEATRLFLCPCHGGGYDLQGRVVMGPPPRPLRRLPVRVEGPDLYLRIA